MLRHVLRGMLGTPSWLRFPGNSRRGCPQPLAESKRDELRLTLQLRGRARGRAPGWARGARNGDASGRGMQLPLRAPAEAEAAAGEGARLVRSASSLQAGWVKGRPWHSGTASTAECLKQRGTASGAGLRSPLSSPLLLLEKCTGDQTLFT